MKKLMRTDGKIDFISVWYYGIFILTIIIIVAFLFSAAGKRSIKSIKSNFNNGIERTITLYDYNGNEIKSWSGKFDVSDSETEIYFDDENGKRVIIHGGIVVNEEIVPVE